MSLSRLLFALVVASMASATPRPRDSDKVIPRQADANCGTSTSTVTSTVSPSGQQTALASIVSITSTVSSVTTVSGSGDGQLTCFSSATTLASAAATHKNRKRDDRGYKVYEFIVDCECDGVAPHTTTSFSTSYFTAPTPSGCSSATTTTTVTTTQTPAAPGASTTTVTTTVVATQTAAAGGSSLASTPQGLNYYFYADQTYPTPQVDFVNVTELPQLLLQVANHSNFTHSGTVANINGLNIKSPNDADTQTHFGEEQTITMPDGYQAHGNMFGLVFQGYLYAASGAGTYQIQSVNPVMDDVGLVWLGPNALGNNWTHDNANYQIILSQPTQQTSVKLAAGEAMPMTIFYANVDGPGHASFNVITPDGTVHEDTTGFFVGGCGNAGFIP